MINFKLKVYRWNIAVVIETKEQAKDLIEWLYKTSDSKLNRYDLEDSDYAKYVGVVIASDHTNGNVFEFCSIDYYKKNNFKIISYNEALL